MKKAAKILCIIALIIGLIWATVGFFGSWIGGAVVATGQEFLGNDSASADAAMETSVNIMLRLLGSFVVVIIGGVLGIVGASKEPSKLKPIILGILTFICGFVLFPLSNYVAAALYLVAGLLLLLAGLTTKIENESADRKRKDLILALISIGIVLMVVVGGYFMLRENPEKQAKIANEVTLDDESEQSVQTMDPKDQFELGEKYYFDDKNFTEAAKWYRMSAEQGYAPAQYELGAMYYDGEGIKQDFSEALKWFRKSADQGNADAQNSLGHMYYLGDGVTENHSEAVKWYRKSAEQGNKYAQKNLGEMYEYGYGITQDYGKAIEWYQKAAKQGNQKAIDKLEYLLESDE
jgi:ABC-type dipeptide/oligopeptide/nickel transport system permease component